MLDGFKFLPHEKTRMIDYFMPIEDKFGYVHSIDNIVVFYLTDISNSEMLEIIRAKSKTFAYLEYWERELSMNPRFANFFWFIHFGDLSIKLGKRMKAKDNYGVERIREINCVSFEINPNKHFTTKEWDFMLELVDNYCHSGIIDKFDYAVDIPVSPDKVVVTKSRKTYGYFDGTRYYGKRNKHGYVKIYDKFKERLDAAKFLAKKLDIAFNPEDYYPCTRIETTLKNGQPFSSVEFGVAGIGELDDAKLTPNNKMYLEMLQHILLLGGDVDEHLRHMNYRSRIAIEPYIYGSLVMYELNADILIELMKNLAELLKTKSYNFNTSGVFYTVEDGAELDIFNDYDLLPLPDEL